MVKRILIRSHASLHRLEGAGGADRLMLQIANALDTSGWEVHILCPRRSQSGRITGHSAQIHEFKYNQPVGRAEKVFNMVRGRKTFIKLCNQFDFDIILDNVSHIPFFPAHFDSPENCVNAIFMHTMFLETAIKFQGLPEGSFTYLVDRTIHLLNSPEIICAGPSTERRIRDQLEYNNTHVLRPSINIKDFDFNYDRTSRQVTYLGRLTPRKNVSVLLHAWEAIERKFPGYNLTIAGTGSHKERLHKLSTELSLENVEFVGYVSEREKQQLLSDSLLFVFPSLIEGYAITGLEALASGTPIIGSDTVGINDYVTNGENGLLFHPDNPEELTSALCRALSRPDLVEKMAENGRELAENHTFEQFTESAEEVFTRMASVRRNHDAI